MEKVALFGAGGALGRAVADELQRRGIPFRAVGRSKRKLEQAFGRFSNVELFPANLAEMREAGAAARGCDTIFYAVGVPYPHFRQHPRLMQATVEAAAAMRIPRLCVVSSVYSYGAPRTPKVAETHPREPEAFKGKMRKQQEDIALQAHRDGLIQTLVLRLPDFYGPYADNSLANPIFRAALAGKKANWLGSADLPHEFVYVPDAAVALIELARRHDVWGEAWNFAGFGQIAARDFITRVYKAAGKAPKWRTAGRGFLRVAGWFSPLMKELIEMQYLVETPVLLDDAKLREKLPHLTKTSYDEGIRRTLEWMKAGFSQPGRAD